MIIIYILLMIAVTISVSITLAAIVAMLGKAFGFAFDDNWHIYKARRIAIREHRKNKDW